MRSLNLPPGVSLRVYWPVQLLSESNSNFLIAFGSAFLFMYMILAAKFESFVHPITILAALPLTIPFAAVAVSVEYEFGHLCDVWFVHAVRDRQEEWDFAGGLYECAAGQGAAAR